ncbi:MAG: NAD(P)/FAD-dependent oxidoreductase [Pseudomonadota bacterium]
MSARKTDPGKTVIIGGGHNGLVAASYLARAGHHVTLLEAAGQLGGAAVTGEIAPGFKAPTVAHILHLLSPTVARDLQLESHGLSLSAKRLDTVNLDEAGGHVSLRDGQVLRASRSPISDDDKANLAKLHRRLVRFAGALRHYLERQAPRLGTRNTDDLVTLGKLGLSLRLLGKQDMREFLRIAGINVYDVLEDELANPLIKGAYGLDAVLGTHLGPRSPGSLITLLYRMAGRVDGAAGALALPRGGMGAVTQALAKAAQAAGAELRCDSPVARILVDGDRAVGVELDDGTTVPADRVVSNADPKRTFLELLGPGELDTGFLRRIKHLRMRGTAAKLNLALDGLPGFRGLSPEDLMGRILVAPSADYVERAFNHVKYGELSDKPALEITLPTLQDASLAPGGKHVCSVVVHYAPYDLKGGWDQAREAFADKLIAQLAHYAPDLPDKLVARQLITPLDLERDFRMTGGQWHHGELALDQFYMLRPVPGAGQYATPLPGLYLCGAGCHPGGGVMGAAGLNAAKRVLADQEAGT